MAFGMRTGGNLGGYKGGKVSGAVGGGMKMTGGKSSKIGGIRSPFTSAVVAKGGKFGGGR